MMCLWGMWMLDIHSAFFSIYLSHLHPFPPTHTHAHTQKAKRSRVMTQQHHDLTSSLTSQRHKFARSAFSDLSLDIKCWMGVRAVCVYGEQVMMETVIVMLRSFHVTPQGRLLMLCYQFNSMHQEKEGEHISEKNVTKHKCHWRNPELTSRRIPGFHAFFLFDTK